MTLAPKVFRVVAFLLIATMLGLFVYNLLFYDTLQVDLEEEINTYGPIAIFIASFIIDTVGGPLGAEVPVISGLLVGINLSTIIVMALLGSYVGSLVVYAIGYVVGESGALRYISPSKYDKSKTLFTRHRQLTLVLGALSPIPYEVTCIIGGIFRMRLWEFMIFAMGARTIRIVGAAYILLLFQRSM